MRSRYRAQWRRGYRRHRLLRLTPEALDRRIEQRAAGMIRRAIGGDVAAFVKILKITGDLPKDYKISE